MVHLTRIYTRTGDDGSTALGNFDRVPKTDARLVAYADVHEANAAIGVAVAFWRQDDRTSPEHASDARASSDRLDLPAVLERVQNDLFDVGADLSVPQNPAPTGPELRVEERWIEELEIYCDEFGAQLPKLNSFILPGGTLTGSQLHAASTVVRRAERSAWSAISEFGTEPEGGVNPLTAKYLNRLSDLLFIMARYANHAAPDSGGERGDVLWQPAGGRLVPPQRRGQSASTQ